jgi:hypothetical protein
LIAVSVGLFLGTVPKHALLGAASELQDERVETWTIARAFLALTDDSHPFRASICHDCA